MRHIIRYNPTVAAEVLRVEPARALRLYTNELCDNTVLLCTLFDADETSLPPIRGLGL